MLFPLTDNLLLPVHFSIANKYLQLHPTLTTLASYSIICQKIIINSLA